jgi:tetrapyrrole methylase family protein / MazG family protein
MSDSSPIRPWPHWNRLQEVARTLRGPDGCSWDRSQSLPDLAGHLVEEAFEVLEACGRASPRDIEEELGDTCFLIALVQAAAEEQGAAPLEEALGRTVAKIIRRHPHVFEERRELDPKDVTLLWEAGKRAEKEGASSPDTVRGFRLPPPAAALPSLLAAQRLQERAAEVGFDWPAARPVVEKIREEVGELEEALALPAEPGRKLLLEELGDLLFSVVNLARWLQANPEEVLRRANEKFRARFNLMAGMAERDGRRIEELELEEMERYWQAVKAANRVSPRSGRHQGEDAGTPEK